MTGNYHFAPEIVQKSVRDLRNKVMKLNPEKAEMVKAEFDLYLKKSIPPMPGFFEGQDLVFPESIIGGEFDKAYDRINKACYKFHHLDRDTLRYANQENYFKMYGEYEPE